MKSSEDRIIGHCPNCASGRNAYVRGRHAVSSTDDDDGTSSRETAMILECGGCGTVYFRRDFWFSEWESYGEHPITGEPRMEGGTQTTYWPPPSARARPTWLTELEERDRELSELLAEMYAALDNDLRVVSAIAARTVFDRASQLLGVDPAARFEEKLETLRADGKISIDDEATLEVLIDAGSAAAHRGWRPKSAELNTMIDVVESFLYRSLIVSGRVEKLRAEVPSRPKRAKGDKA